jgi:hypothetical protein
MGSDELAIRVLDDKPDVRGLERCYRVSMDSPSHTSHHLSASPLHEFDPLRGRCLLQEVAPVCEKVPVHKGQSLVSRIELRLNDGPHHTSIKQAQLSHAPNWVVRPNRVCEESKRVSGHCRRASAVSEVSPEPTHSVKPRDPKSRRLDQQDVTGLRMLSNATCRRKIDGRVHRNGTADSKRHVAH